MATFSLYIVTKIKPEKEGVSEDIISGHPDGNSSSSVSIVAGQKES